MPPRLFLNHIASLDWLVALEFGRVDEGQPPECWHGVSAQFGYLRSAPQDDFVGFKVLRFSAFDPDSPDNAAIWSGPRFDAPVLGLANVSAGEIVLAARVLFGGEPTVNRRFFEQAVAAEGETAVELWLACLEAGDAMAHFGLGCALYEMGRYHEAYRHLRHYAEIAPHQAWNWCWRGKAAEALGELGEARAAYERAIALEADGGDATDAPALLAALDTPPARLVLWGDDHPELGEQRVEALGDDAAAGITAGARPKGYAHVDPNEDVVAVVRGEHGTLLVCADGHNGATASRLAVEEVLRRLGDEPPPADLDDAALVSMWHAAGETIQRVTGERGHPHPESRTTLLVALIGNGRLQWAAMGDSLLALVDRNGVARRLDTPRHHFVGWPMFPTAVAQRLRRGRAELGPDEWVVLVTDGFSDFVPQPALGSIAAMAAGAPHARAVAQRLLDTALSAGAGDNVAVAVGRGRPAASRLTHADRARGCLLGVAVGDAVGAPIEFLKLGASGRHTDLAG